MTRDSQPLGQQLEPTEAWLIAINQTMRAKDVPPQQLPFQAWKTYSEQYRSSLTQDHPIVKRIFAWFQANAQKGSHHADISAWPRLQRHLRLENLPAWLSVFVGAVYIAGYAVSNSHYASLEIPRPTILNARYLSAGIAWLMLTGLPTMMALAATEYAFTHWITKDRIRAVLAPITLCALAVAITYEVLQYVGVRDSHPPSLIYAGGCYVAVFAMIGTTLWLRSSGELNLWARRVTHVLSFFAVPFISLSYFGTQVYPNILPQFGGGAARLGMVELKSTAESPVIPSLRGHSVPIIGQDDKFVYTALCSPLYPSRPVALAIPIEAVQAVQLITDSVGRKAAINVRVYLDSLTCHAKQRPVVGARYSPPAARMPTPETAPLGASKASAKADADSTPR